MDDFFPEHVFTMLEMLVWFLEGKYSQKFLLVCTWNKCIKYEKFTSYVLT